MAEAQTSSKKGLTRGKAILIGILSVALGVILYVQFGRDGENPAGEAVASRPPRPAIAVQPSNAVATVATSVTLAAAKTPSNGQVSKEKNDGAAALIDETRWKAPKLEMIVAYDPFALPATFPQPPKVAIGAKGKAGEALIAAAAADDAKKLAEAEEKLHLELDELRQQGVHVILFDRERDQYVAVIGERLLHVGDKINEFTVTAIDPDGGVDIERKESP